MANSELLYRSEDICPVCQSAGVSLSALNQNTFIDNFYLEAVRDQLGMTVEELDKTLKVYECDDCATLFCNPWFSSDTAFRIFNEIYAQHNRGWDALYGWLRDKEIQDYWDAFEQAEKRLGKVETYAEYHCPFQGNFFKFRSMEVPKNKREDFYQSHREYLLASSPGKSLSGNVKLKSRTVWERRKHGREKLDRLNEDVETGEIKRYLLLEPSTRFWDYGCISSGVNCKALASGLLDISVMPFSEFEQQNKRLDVFAFINTLDHAFQPMQLLERAMKISRAVILVNHAQQIITKQHHFVFQRGFADYLKRRPDIEVEDLSDSLDFKSNESNQQKISLLITKRT